ncbi:hypothetical protein SAMN05421835_1563 [Amycolatopsis sacchari]|uniref:Uncharacterized protein n=1 Tax=Amycolatopsis sacchari TaxID=115433 RepID=A0A1I4DR13_9PSEU|nr:hypothetical protein SAMN05421835_1563 [Amycolatopsis sacchari]
MCSRSRAPYCGDVHFRKGIHPCHSSVGQPHQSVRCGLFAPGRSPSAHPSSRSVHPLSASGQASAFPHQVPSAAPTLREVGKARARGNPGHNPPDPPAAQRRPVTPHPQGTRKASRHRKSHPHPAHPMSHHLPPASTPATTREGTPTPPTPTRTTRETPPTPARTTRIPPLPTPSCSPNHRQSEQPPRKDPTPTRPSHSPTSRQPQQPLRKDPTPPTAAAAEQLDTPSDHRKGPPDPTPPTSATARTAPTARKEPQPRTDPDEHPATPGNGRGRRPGASPPPRHLRPERRCAGSTGTATCAGDRPCSASASPGHTRPRLPARSRRPPRPVTRHWSGTRRRVSARDKGVSPATSASL